MVCLACAQLDPTAAYMASKEASMKIAHGLASDPYHGLDEMVEEKDDIGWDHDYFCRFLPLPKFMDL